MVEALVAVVEDWWVKLTVAVFVVMEECGEVRCGWLVAGWYGSRCGNGGGGSDRRKAGDSRLDSAPVEVDPIPGGGSGGGGSDIGRSMLVVL